jgi:hypothetical protein
MAAVKAFAGKSLFKGKSDFRSKRTDHGCSVDRGKVRRDNTQHEIVRVPFLPDRLFHQPRQKIVGPLFRGELISLLYDGDEELRSFLLGLVHVGKAHANEPDGSGWLVRV